MLCETSAVLGFVDPSHCDGVNHMETTPACHGLEKLKRVNWGLIRVKVAFKNRTRVLRNVLFLGHNSLELWTIF